MKHDENTSLDPQVGASKSSIPDPDEIQSILDKLRASFGDPPEKDADEDDSSIHADPPTEEEAFPDDREPEDPAPDSADVADEQMTEDAVPLFAERDADCSEETEAIPEETEEIEKAELEKERDMSAEAFERRRRAAREKLAAVELPEKEPELHEPPVTREIPVDHSARRRESVKLSEPTLAGTGRRDSYRDASLDERLALLHRIRDEYRFGTFDTPDTPKNPDVEETVAPTQDVAPVSPDEIAVASPVSADDTPEAEALAPSPVTDEPLFSEKAEADTEIPVAEAAETETEAPLSDDAAGEISEPYSDESSDGTTELTDDTLSVETDTQALSTEEIPDDLILIEPPKDPVFDSEGDAAETAVVAAPELPTEREELVEDVTVPEEVADREPFNDDDYVISDKTMDEEMASGESGREYVSYNQNRDIVTGYRRRIRIETVKLVLMSFLATILFVTENAFLFRWRLPFFGDDYGIKGLPVLLNLQLLLLIACLALPQLKRGIRVFRDKRFTTETYAVFLVFMAVVYDVVLYAADTDGAHMFSFCAALYLVVGAAFDLLRLNGDYMTFQVVSSTARKTVAMTASLGNFREETAVLHGILDDDEALVSETRRAGFVEGFFTRSGQKEVGASNAFVFLFSVVFALLAFLYSYFMGDGVLLESFYVFSVFFSACMPVSAIFARSYPFHEVVKRSVLADSAVVGEYSATEYAASEVFVVEDTDLFPSRNVKVKGIKLFGDNRLDRVLCRVSALFKTVGGPLSGVFGTVGAATPTVEDVVVRKTAPNGIEARLDGSTFLVGDGEFMEQHHVTLFYDSEDARQIDSKVSILYAAENGIVSARFYLQYIPEPTFERTVERLTREGLSVLIRTFDPCVSDRLIEKVSYISSLPVRVVPKRIEVLDEEKRPRLNSGIVTTAASSSLVDVLFRCIRFSRIAQHEGLIKVLSSVIGAGMLAALLFFERFSMLSSAMIAFYQIFWLFPVYLTTKLFLKE